MSRIAIIGAGITGVTTAYALVRRGHQVTVFDRQRYPGMVTSYANGGQLSASNAEVWNSRHTIFKGLKWLLRKDAPLSLNPKPSWHKVSWLAEFVAAIRKYEVNTVATARLAIMAREHLYQWARDEMIEFDWKPCGILHIYGGKADFDAAMKVNKLLAAAGLDRRAVTPAEIRGIEPSVRPAFFGGFYTPSDSTGDIHKYTRGLAEAARRKGVRFISEVDVTQIWANENFADVSWRPAGERAESGVKLLASSAFDIERAQFDSVVICAGVESRRLAAHLGDRVNIYPVKGYSITVNLLNDCSRYGAPQVSLLDDAAKIVTSRLGPNRFRVAGTAELNGENYDIRHDRVKPLVDWTRRLFPDIDTDRVVPWAGLRPMMPNMMPRVGRGCRPTVFYNTGHGHLGWTLSAATAELLAAEFGSS